MNLNQIWAIDPAALQAAVRKLDTTCLGHPQSFVLALDNVGEVAQDERMEAFGGAESAAVKGVRPVTGAVQILRIHGGIEQHPYDVWGIGTSTEDFGRRFDAAIADPTVAAVVLDVNSPGGTVFGVPELADKIAAARGSKPVVAVANSYAASAGYWLAAAAEKLFVAPSGKVGSVGVFAMHVDISGAMEKFGEKVTFIAAGKYKVEGNPFEPLSAEAREEISKSVQGYYESFTGSLAKYRGTTRKDVEANYGQGRMLSAKAAGEVGMADGIATLQEVLAALGIGKKPAGMKAEHGDPDLLRRKGIMQTRGV